MPIKYIGKTTHLKGKTLWEIVGNLKDFGVGRIIVRSIFARYPEPCYMKICKVEALPNAEVRKAKVWVEKVFRGHKFPEPVVLHITTYKPDYQLIPKDEEEEFCKYKPIMEAAHAEKTRVLPKTMPFPPLLRELIIRDMKLKGQPVEEPMMEVVYQLKKSNNAKLVTDNMKPTIEVNCRLGKPASPHLYEGVL